MDGHNMENIEDTEINELEHNKLLNAVAKLDKTQHIKCPTRNEPTNLTSEFNLIKSTKLDINKVVKVLENTAHHVQIGKKVKKTQNSSNVLSKPLEKPQAERVRRATGYEQTKKRLSRWDAVVARSRTVDFVSFPLKSTVTKSTSKKLQPTKAFLSKLKIKSPLELELEEIDQPVVEEESEDEEHLYPMSYLEMMEQRQNLAKLRAQQSFKAAKAKRQSKIKSKKYHRILKKEKLKLQLKEFEELQKTNPEEALKKLEALEKARALERHTLRHKNTGKWAKSKAVRAKYDKEARQQLAEQLAVSRGLTQKTHIESSDDEVEGDGGIPDFTLSQDPFNPWMVQRSDKSIVDAEFDFGCKKHLKDRMFHEKENDSDTDIDESDQNKNMIRNAKSDFDVVIDRNDKKEEQSNKDNIQNVTKQGAARKNKIVKRKSEENNQSFNIKSAGNDSSLIVSNSLKKSKSEHDPIPKVVSTENWIVEPIEKGEGTSAVLSTADVLNAFDDLDNNIQSKFKRVLNSFSNSLEKSNDNKKSNKPKDHSELQDNLKNLEFKNNKLKSIIDEELNESSSYNVDALHKDSLQTKVLEKSKHIEGSRTQSDSNIDPSHFIKVKPTYLNTSLSQAEHDLDELDDEEQVVPKVNIEEVFEDDDVVASFRQEKEEEANKDNSADIELNMPGWGSWGGKGVKAPKRKSNRFILKAPPKTPRRDENKGDIIIKEYKDPKLAVHRVTDVPHPFESVKEYEATIRTPLGNTFIPENAHQKLIKPNVITKIGSIINPMDEDELLVPRNMNYKNKSVIKLLAKK